MSDTKAPESKGRGPLPTLYPHEPARIQKGAELIAAMRRGEIEIGGEEGLPADAFPRNIDHPFERQDEFETARKNRVGGGATRRGADVHRALRQPLHQRRVGDQDIRTST